MRKQLVIDRMKHDADIHQAECERQPIKTLQDCLLILYKNQRHQPDFGPLHLDGLRQAQKDLDHLVNLAAGNPPNATKKSAMLRQMAADPMFAASAKQLVDKAEKLEKQAEGLRYKFAKDRGEKKQ